MLLTVMLIAEPRKVNHILAILAEKEIEDVSLQPISLAPLAPQDVMITYRVKESHDGAISHLSWMEEELGPWCKIY